MAPAQTPAVTAGTADAAAEWSITTDDLALNPSNSGDSTNAYELGTALTGIAGDTYVVCWGHDPQAPEDYNVEVDGDAALTGPLVGDRQCTMGVDCQIFLEGHDELLGLDHVADLEMTPLNVFRPVVELRIVG